MPILTTVLQNSNFNPEQFSGLNLTLNFHAGLTTLLGGNGTGKTVTLKALRDQLRKDHGDVVRYISAGRMGVLETYRSNNTGTGQNNPDDTSVGHYTQVYARKQSETVIGDFISLESNSDVRLKVEARLQGLFNKTLKLNWTHSGLKIEFKNLDAGSAFYGGGNEASGLTQLVSILAALYDNEINYLLLDEPEVSLHPQLQSFILKEILQVAGDPAQTQKKLVVISTHSPAMLHLRQSTDLPSIIFFNSSKEHPTQIDPTNPILADNQFRSLIIRLAEIYKIAFFAKNILLSEGVSDQFVISALADVEQANFETGGVQIVPLSGKGDIVNAHGLFRLIGKKVCAIADLDVLDDANVIGYVDTNLLNQALLTAKTSFADLASLYHSTIADLDSLILNNWSDISNHAQSQTYYGSGTKPLEKKRSVLSFIASKDNSVISTLSNSTVWLSFKTKLQTLLDLLDDHDIVLIRRGSLEDCFINTLHRTNNKPIDSATEADFLILNPQIQLLPNYLDVLKVISKAKITQPVDEAYLLRAELATILGPIVANLTPQTTQVQIENSLNTAKNGVEKIFEMALIPGVTPTTLNIRIVSPLFLNHPKTFTFTADEKLDVLQQRIPSQ